MTDRPGGATPPAGRRSAGRLHLSPRHRAQIVALLGEHLPGVEVWAYGSRITGESHDGSDLDLVLRAPDLQKIPIGRLSDLWEALRESTIPFLVEARDWARLPEGFHEEIERDYVVLVEETKQHDDNGRLTTTLGDVITLKRGYDLSRHERVDGPVPVVSSSGIIDYHSDSKVSGPGVVTGRYGTLGQVFFIPNDFWPLNTALYVQDFKGNDPRFIAYFLRTLDFSAYSDKAAVPGLNRNHLHQESVRIPTSISEQRAIAHVLGALDDKIELNRRMNETLEAMARALFQSWFVDFDPVRARMEGRDTGLPKEIADLFPDRMVDSELGPIPDGWTTSALEDHIDATRGLSYKGSGLSETGLAMHNLNSVHEGGGYKYDGIKHYDGPYKDRHIVHPGEVIVANTEQGHDRLLVGHAAIVPRRYRSGLFTHHLYRVRVKDPLDAEYVCQMLNTVAMHDAVSGYATGTTVNMLPMDALRIPRILLPAPRIVAVFGTFAATVRGKAETIHDESENLARLRDALLPELVSGALRVDRTVPPVRCA